MSNDRLTATVDTFGAELSSLTTADGSEWLWQGDPNSWSGRAPVLFPVVGRSPEGLVSVSGRAFPMSSHGFARESRFDVVENNRTRCRLQLVDTPATRLSFPFAFRLDVSFVLDEATLGVAVEVANTGEVTLPCSFGLHPGFVWPLPGTAGLPHFVVLDDQAEPPARRLDDRGLMLPDIESPVFRNGRLPLRSETFERGAVFHEGGWGSVVRFGVANGPMVKLETRGFPNLGLWTRPGARFLCIEPCLGLPPIAGTGNPLDARPGTMLIPSGGQISAQTRITPIPNGNMPGP